MKIPKLDKRKKRFMMVSLIALSFFVAGGIMFAAPGEARIKSLFDYADMSYTIKVLGIPNTLEAGETVSVLFNDIVTVEVAAAWDVTKTYNHPPEVQCKIFGGPLDLFYQDDAWATPDNVHVFRWTFDLKDIPTGNFAYRFEFVGYYPQIVDAEVIYDGTSFTFYIDKAAEEVPDIPKLLSSPEDFEMRVTESKDLKWEYQYKKDATITVKENGVVVKTEASIPSSASQFFHYLFSPSETAEYVIEFAFDPDFEDHPTLESTTTVTVLSSEDYDLLEGLPEGVECTVEVTGQIAFFTILPSKQVWNAEFAAPAMTPLDGKMTVVLHTSAFTAAKVLIFRGEELVETMNMGKFVEAWLVDIDLSSLEDGEYKFEIRCEYAGQYWYRITTFNMAVRVFPTGWFVVNTGLLLLIGVLAIGTIIALRRFRGWWSFRGRYAV